MFEYYVLWEYLSVKMLKVYIVWKKAEYNTILQNFKFFHINHFLLSFSISPLLAN